MADQRRYRVAVVTHDVDEYSWYSGTCQLDDDRGGTLGVRTRRLFSVSPVYEYEAIEGEGAGALEWEDDGEDDPEDVLGPCTALVPVYGSWDEKTAVRELIARCGCSGNIEAVRALATHLLLGLDGESGPVSEQTLVSDLSARVLPRLRTFPPEFGEHMRIDLHNLSLGAGFCLIARYASLERLEAHIAPERCSPVIAEGLLDLAMDLSVASSRLEGSGEALLAALQRHFWCGMLTAGGAARLLLDAGPETVATVPELASLLPRMGQRHELALFLDASRASFDDFARGDRTADVDFARESGAVVGNGARALTDDAVEVLSNVFGSYRRDCALPNPPVVGSLDALLSLLQKRGALAIHHAFDAWGEHLDGLVRDARWVFSPGYGGRHFSPLDKHGDLGDDVPPLHMIVLLHVQLWTLPEMAMAIAEALSPVLSAASSTSEQARYMDGFRRPTLPKIVLFGNFSTRDPHGTTRFLGLHVPRLTAVDPAWGEGCPELARAEKAAAAGRWGLVRDILASNLEQQQEKWDSRPPKSKAPFAMPAASSSLAVVAARRSEVAALRRRLGDDLYELRNPEELVRHRRDVGQRPAVVVEQELLGRSIRSLYDARAACRALYLQLEHGQTPTSLAIQMRDWPLE